MGRRARVEKGGGGEGSVLGAQDREWRGERSNGKGLNELGREKRGSALWRAH